MKNILKNLGLLAMSLVISLILGEILVRIIAPQQLIVPSHDIWRPDEYIGWRHRENADAIINTGEGIVHFITDDNGYRINAVGEEGIIAEPDISIITIGDSFLEAVQVENQYTMARVIQEMLTKKFNKRVRVVNDGVGAWSPDQYLMEAKLALEKDKYDLGIIFLYTGNDIINRKNTSFSPQVVSSKHRFRLPRSFKWGELISALFYPTNDLLEENSHLFVFLKNRTQSLRSKVGLAADAYFPPIFRLSDKSSKRWRVTTKICAEIQDLFLQNRIPVLFVLLPPGYQVNKSSFYKSLGIYNVSPDSVDINQPDSILQDMFKADSLKLLDPLEHMRDLAEGGLVMYGEIDGHFNADGHKVVAEYIMTEIEKCLSNKLD